LPSFGEKLKLEREKRKITLEQISSTTKISVRLLHALEDEKFSQLPGGIFNKGFVRAYARTLGLDEEQAVADYLEASGEAPAVRIETGGRDGSRESGARLAPLRITDDNSGRLEIRAEVASRQLPWGMFAVVLLIVALALSLWNYRRLERARLANHPPANQPLGNQQKTSQPTAQAVAPVPAAAGTEAAPAPAEQIAAAAPNATTPPRASVTQPESRSRKQASPALSSTTTSSPSQAATGPSKPEAKPQEAAAQPPPGEFVVAIRARDDSWISAVVDGRSIGSETIEAGAERAYRAQNLVTIKAGNVGALDFRLNGKTLPVGGDLGEVKTITIGPAGLAPVPSSPAP